MTERPKKIEALVIHDSERDNLRISWDEEDGFVFLFTPDMKDPFPHFHVELTNDEAVQLCSFLDNRLGELEVKA